MIAPRRRPAAVLLLLLAVTALAALAGIAHSARLPDRGAGAIVVDAAEAAAATVVDAAAAASSSSSPHQQNRKKHRRRRKPKNPYSSPLGLFIQERASKMLPGPGQHFSFGALRPWEDVAALLEEKPGESFFRGGYARWMARAQTGPPSEPLKQTDPLLVFRQLTKRPFPRKNNPGKKKRKNSLRAQAPPAHPPRPGRLQFFRRRLGARRVVPRRGHLPLRPQKRHGTFGRV
jgi:hypothetical protein